MRVAGQGFVDSQGVYDQPGFTRLGFSSWFLHMAPVARFGASKGTVRPFAVFTWTT